MQWYQLRAHGQCRTDCATFINPMQNFSDNSDTGAICNEYGCARASTSCMSVLSTRPQNERNMLAACPTSPPTTTPTTTSSTSSTAPPSLDGGHADRVVGGFSIACLCFAVFASL